MTRHRLPAIMVVYVSTLHGLWGILIALWPQTLKTTPLYGLGVAAEQLVAMVFGVWIWPIWILIFTLSAASVLAIAGTLRAPSFIGLVCMIPQQFLLLVSAWTALQAAILGAYPDGVPREWPFILADQLPIILAAPFYTLAIIACHAPPE